MGNATAGREVASELVLPGGRPSKGSDRVVPLGRHGRPKEEIEKIQRDRILDAFVIVVGRTGLAKAHVADVCAEAGVSTREFYAVFLNKDDCFLSAFDAGARLVFQGAKQAYEQAEGRWEDRLRATLDVVFGLLGANPAFARLCILESQYAGPVAGERLSGIVRGFRRTFGGGEIPSLSQDLTGDGLESVLIGGAFRPVVEYVREGKADRLPELVPLVTYFLTLAVVGPERAARQLTLDRTALD